MDELGIGFLSPDDIEEIVEVVEVEEQVKKEELPQFFYSTREFSILPQNERTRNQKLSKEKMEEQRRILEENERKLLQEKNKKLFEDKEKRRRELEEEDARRKKLEQEEAEEKEELANIIGEFGNLLTTLTENTTKFVLSLTEYKLSKIQIRIFFKAIAQNSSLKTLSLHRKKLKAEDIYPLLNSLMNNRTLEKLELDENHIVGEILYKFGEVLAKNETLRCLSLNDNNIFSTADSEAVTAFCKALENNDSLNYLSLSSTSMTQFALDSLINMLETNRTIINIDIGFNNGLSNPSIIKLQEALARNKALYEEERLSEFIERRVLKESEKQMIENNLKKKNRVEEIKNIETECTDNYVSKMKIFKDEMEKLNERDRRLERELEKEALARASKKKRVVAKEN